MKDKKNGIIFLLLMLTVAISFTSCSKTKNNLFKGYYTFKTSATIDMTVTTTCSSGNVSTEAKTFTLDTENGQMNILSVDNKTGEMIVTMNILNGEVIKYNAIASDKTLTIDNQKRTIKFYDGLTPIEMDVTVSGTGSKYDETVVMSLNYNGTYTDSGIVQSTKYTITGSEINCVARSND